MLGDETEVEKLVRSAHIKLTEAWEILRAQEPDDDAYSQLRLIANDLKAWQKERSGKR